MNEHSESTPTNSGLRGASAGGIIGITIWQILSGNFLGIGFVAGLLILCAYMGLCMLLGMTIERLVARK
jgi:hypothetical protein